MNRFPDSLDSIPRTDFFPGLRHRWNTNDEIASILITLDGHEDWLSKEVKIRPKSGSMLLYSRKKVRYRRDGYCWKKRKDGKTTREDHMKLKVQGTECIYGCYVHSALLPTFHRRCYWLLQNPDIVLVHYLNVPFSDDNKMTAPMLSSFVESKKEWTKEELISELKPMFYSESEPDLNNELDLSSVDTIECIVQELMTRQRARIKEMEEESDCARGISKNPIVRQPSCDNMIDVPPSTSSSGRLRSVAKNGKNLLMKKDVSGIQSDTKNVPIMQFGTQGPVIPTTTTSAMNGSQTNPTSLIFNLSQFQSGNGTVLILNSSVPQTRTLQGPGGPTENPSITAPVTLVYSRPGDSSTIDTTSLTEQRSEPILMKPPTFQAPAAVSSDDSHINNRHQYKSSELNYSTSPANVDATNGNIFDHTGQASSSLTQEINMDTSYNNCLLKSSNHSSLSESPSNRSDVLNSGILPNSPFMRSESSGSLIGSQQRNINYNVGNKNPSLEIISNSSSNGPNNRYYSGSKLINQSLQSDSDDMNPMDFIDNGSATPDDNLFNLEAFEMLTDLPNLDDLNSSTNNLFNHHHHHQPQQQQKDNQQTESNPEYRSSVPQIADYSPDWSYPEGGMKVLVAGPWTSPMLQYSIVFDGMSVPTSLVQNGVLRCFSPAHEPGYVSLQVCIEGNIVSNSVIFEYRDHPATPVTQCTEDYFSIDDNVFKFCLLERLELLETHVSVSSQMKENNSCSKAKSFEERLIAMCEHVMSSPWLPCNVTSVTSQSLRSGSSRTDMSLLHLSAALGYSNLIEHLIGWRTENPSIVLEVEVDAFSCDKNECTPLMWAMSRDHREASLLLLRWNKGAINLCNKQGRSPLQVARRKGFNVLADEIEKLQRELLLNSSSSDDSLLLSSSSSLKIDSSEAEKQPPATPTDHVSIINKKTSSRASFSSCSQKRYYFCSGHFHEARRFQRKTSSCDTGVELGLSSSDEEEEDDDLNDGELGDVSASNPCSGSCLSSQRSSFGACDTSDGMEFMEVNSDRVLTIAEHIIAAIPDRIKGSHVRSDLESSGRSDQSDSHSNEMGMSVDTIMNHFKESSYRYVNDHSATPTSSPGSASLQSPGSITNLESPSPPPTTADLCEFFQASDKLMQKEFSSLTLSDQEQRELYEAAKTIQKAYRVYKGRKRQEQEKERSAAILIQSYYRRYKQYMYYKQMTRAAQVIQNQFRNYCSKRFKKCNNPNGRGSLSSSTSTTSIPGSKMMSMNNSCLYGLVADSSQGICDASPSNGLKRTYSQRRQHQAARKIQQFLRQSKNKLQKERAMAAVEKQSDHCQDLECARNLSRKGHQDSDLRTKVLSKKEDGTKDDKDGSSVN